MENKKILLQKITDDFNTMRNMLTDIEISIMPATLSEQIEFYQPLQGMILAAWLETTGEKQYIVKEITQYGK